MQFDSQGTGRSTVTLHRFAIGHGHLIAPVVFGRFDRITGNVNFAHAARLIRTGYLLARLIDREKVVIAQGQFRVLQIANSGAGIVSHV